MSQTTITTTTSSEPTNSVPSSLPTRQKIYLYVLRHAPIEENFKIRAYFENDVKFTFNRLDVIDSKSKSSPTIYCAELDLAMDQEKNLYFHQSNGAYLIQNYRLRLSRKIPSMDTTFLDFNDAKERAINNPFQVEHYFIFDVEFADRLVVTAPPGHNVPFFDQLFIYTFYLLREKMYDVFKILIEQFQEILQVNRWTMIPAELNQFFQGCYQYLQYSIPSIVNQNLSNKILIQMTGILPVPIEYIKIDNVESMKFLQLILGDIRLHYNHILANVTKRDWISFRDGLVFYFSHELLSQPKDTMKFIEDMQVEELQIDLANCLLQRLEELQRPVLGLNWTNLFNLVDSSVLSINQLNLTRSIETYITCLMIFFRTKSNDADIVGKINRHFDDSIRQDRLPVHLTNIDYLVRFLQTESNSTEENEREIMKLVISTIESSANLREKIRRYLYSIKIFLENFRQIRLLISSMATNSILFHVRRRDLLIHLMNNAVDNHSYEFFKQWFFSFLLFDEEITDVNKREYQELVQHWWKQICKVPEMIMKIFADIDQFLPAFQNANYRTIFINQMIQFAFEQKHLNRVLAEGLINIANEAFLYEFEKQFQHAYLNIPPEKFKQISNHENPLYQLLTVNKQIEGKSLLINRLIQLIANKIQFTSEEILRDTFEKPSRTSIIYIILFDIAFQSSKLHQTLVDQLLAIWNTWEERGLRAHEIVGWKKFNSGQRQIIQQIWNYVGDKAKKQYQIDSLIAQQQLEMDEKIRIKETITKCLEIYCSNACDKEKYLHCLTTMDQQLESGVVRSIVIPKEIETLLPLAERLNPLEKLYSWKTFLQDNRQNIPLTTTTTTDEVSSPDIIDDESLLSDEQSGAEKSLFSRKFRTLSQSSSSTMKSFDQRSCLDILNENIHILDMFINRLTDICSEWKTSSISNLLDLFPDIQYVNHDFEILKPLIPSSEIVHLQSILDCWKDREFINQVFRGYTNLIHRLDYSDDEIYLSIKDIPDITPQSNGFECYTRYQVYSENFLHRRSKELRQLLAQFVISNELITFIDTIPATDVDNLVQAVNDSDETLIDTQTMLDFSMLKRFFVEFNEGLTVNKTTTTSSTALSQIDEVFQKIFDHQYHDMFSCFQSCSKFLPNIRQLSLELSDKKLSKRNRISDLMRESTFHFVEQNKEFSVEIKPQLISFHDLSELRDRARLIEYSRINTNKLTTDSEQDLSELHSFVTFVEIIEKILKNFTLLNIAGHPMVINYLSPKKSFVCRNHNYQELIELSLILDDLLYDWEIHLCQMYEKHLDLTYFSYQQFWIVEEYLYNQIKSLDRSHPGYHLLKYISIQPESIQSAYLPIRNQQANERLENLGRILTAQRGNLEWIVKHEARTTKKVYLVETSDEGILRAIVSLFTRFNTPKSVKHLFFCTEETSWMEIRAFTYRCFYSQTFQQLIRPECLSAAIQDQFTRLLRQFIDKYPQHYFRLSLITTVSTTHLQLINGLRALQIVQTIQDQELFNPTDFHQAIKQSIGENSLLITSRINGLGKSYFIRNDIEKKEKKYIKFPISGDIDLGKIAQRLCAYGNLFSTAALHFDIGAINHLKQLNELLYCLLIFRSFRFGQQAVFIPENTPIYIELDSSPHSYDLQEKIVPFKYMTIKSIERIHWNDFQIINSHAVQLVVNYLQAMNDKTILKRDINAENVVQFDRMAAIELLKQPFLEKKNPDFVNWTQLSIFLSVYHRLFTGFSRCGYFIIDVVGQAQLRYDIVESLLQSANQFTSLCVDNVRLNQRSVSTNDAIVTFSDSIVRWDKTQPFTVVFSQSNNPIFVYKKPINVPETLVQAYRHHYEVLTRRKDFELNEIFPDYSKFTHAEFFRKLATLSLKYFNKAVCLNCYQQYEYQQKQCLQCEPKEDLFRPVSFDTKDVEKFQHIVAERIRTEYVLTPDNYIKMLLIYLRVQSGLPVLIMGETGCGKTALIQFLCQKILDDELRIFRIHAGVTSEKIIKRMKKYSDDALACHAEDRRLWVFFDEFNTTPNIGLIKEITCERTLLGKPLPNNMIFLGACNPQRRKRESRVSDNHIGIKKDLYEMQRLKDSSGISLLYTVVPIPETMLEYVWDYGYLDDEIETKYIRTMLNTCKQLGENANWFTHVVKAISQSQKFFREFEDVSSVSLRDVSRFCRFYNWFRKSILHREGAEKFATDASVLVRRSSLLALLLCYYFRLSSPKDRTAYVMRMEEIFKGILTNLSNVTNFLVKILENEQKKIIELMELPPGTAKNRALMDNIFVLLVCIVNRVPVIICGKPGCSKTSAVQIVINNLKGQKSSQEYFQQLPELITVSYQGSQNCTSESIIKVFQRADKYLTAQSNTDILPVIVFDEIGLAELSPHNPLKVLHSHLEVETCQYGFVGLSNWRLDASKMNRTLYLSCPDPDVTDLKLTAQIISNSIVPKEGQLTRIDSSIIEALAVAYYNLYEKLKTEQNQQKYANYFGLRDFYSLIKGVVYDLLQNGNENAIYELILQQLIINFDGILNGAHMMWNDFCEYINRKHLIEQYKTPTFKQLLDRQLTSRRGRYLMLIAENESVIDYVERYILVKHHSSPVRTIIGSSLSGDLLAGRTYSEQYNYRVLMDVILYAETNVTLIMRRMGHLYDNLYDLFNQNFSISSEKKYCRIALGALYHPRCLVNDDFYCVVFVRHEDLAECDPPFLNRFEKHVVDMKSLVHERQWLLTDQLSIELTNLLPKNLKKTFPLLQHLFVDYSEDYICNLVIDAFDYLNLSLDDDNNSSKIIEYCHEKLIRTSSFDLPLTLSLQSKEEIHPMIDQYYQIHSQLSFQQVIQQALTEDILTNQIIYTYTQIYHEIKYDKQQIDEVKLGIFKTELELTNRIKQHYQKHDEHRLLIIRVDYHQEHEHILLLKHILLNCNIQSINRSIWLIFHLQRNMLNQIQNDVLFNGWSTLMIDDLNNHQLIPKEILIDPSYRNLVSHPNFILSENIFDELIDRCLTKFRYTVSRKDQQTLINIRRNQIIENLNLTIDSQSLRSIIREHLWKLIQQISLNRFKDWREDLLTNGILIGTCRSFNDALQSIISIFYENYLLLLFAHLEKYSFIDSYQYLHSQGWKNQLWLDCLTSTLEHIDTTVLDMEMIEMPLIFHLHLPCALTEYEIIRSIRQMISQRRENDINEDDLIYLAYKQLRNKSIYSSNIELIFNEKDFFQSYFSDQLVLAQEEAKIYYLSSKFIQRLVMTNPKRTIVERLKLLLIDYNEFFEILRIFEISMKLIDENQFLEHVFNRQFLILDQSSDKRKILNDTTFYRLILTNEHFYLIPPGNEMSEEMIFQCDGDALIEVTLMNLIEYLVAQSIFDSVKNIEQLTTTYSLVSQSILGLNHYPVNNLEKLRSFISLIRGVTTLIPNEKSLKIFKQACRYASFDGTFATCTDVHKFIIHLQRIINTNEPNLYESVVQRTLLKLESDFLKNWLNDHEEGYLDLISLLNRSDNDLWVYSAKVFTFIDQKLQILSMINTFHGQLPTNDQVVDELKEFMEKYELFDQHLQTLNDPSRKIEHLMVTRFHMHLIRTVNDQDTMEELLDEHFTQFEQNLHQLQNSPKKFGLTFVSLISWLKYYAQMYSFVLMKNSHHPILEKLDKLLTRDDYLIGSTIKLFVIKQFCQLTKFSLDDLRENMRNRNITWIRPMITPLPSQSTFDVRENLILPIPIFECNEEFLRVDRILTDYTNLNEIRQLIERCRTNQSTFYSFIIWFIHYYARFYVQLDQPIVNDYQRMIEHDLSREIIDCFDRIGYKLLVFLCTNFPSSNYFQLNSKLTLHDLHQRLIALNIMAILLSFKTLTHVTYFGSLLFDGNLKMSQDYTNHIQQSVCLPGLLITDPIITQMIDVRTTVKERLDQGLVHQGGRFVFRCSKDCHWMFYFVNCGVPVDRSHCPLCKKEIGAAQYGVLIQRDPPQIRMTIDEGFQFIQRYIEEFNKIPRLGYHNQTAAMQSNEHEKSDHLNRTISYRFIHLLTHGYLLVLDELSLLPEFPVKNRSQFREHFEKDYTLLCQQSTDANQCYIWLYKLLNHMLSKEFIIKGFLNTNEKVIQLEKLLEEKLIFSHIDSITNEINQYKTVYAEYVQRRNEEATFENLFYEIFQNEKKYPYLNFFNVTDIHTSNSIEGFSVRLQNVPYADQLYPVTTFLMKRLGDFANIQYLYPIIVFTNYLIEKFNHRIKRNDASETTISYYLTHGSDGETLSRLYQQFLDAWYKLTVTEVRYGCQVTKFHLPSKKDDFANNTKLAMVLLNTSKDDSSILLAACLRTIGELQNEIIHFFHNKIAQDAGTNPYQQNAIPLQSIRPEHILHLDANVINSKLINDGFTINYQYGKSKDIIYDYEEIEFTLRNQIGRLPLIDTEKLRFLNYQFELYSENTSLINDVRRRVKQEFLKENDRIKYKNLIIGMQNDDILHYLGSLDYVFTYLRNIDDETTNHTSMTIQAFVEKHIRTSACLNDNVLQRHPFATINLRFIIDLYELIEECAFDQVLRHYIKQNLTEEFFPNEERAQRIKQFSDSTFKKETITPTLKSIDPWIGILKRLIVRVLSNTNVSVDVPIQIYLERTDLWTGNITEGDIQTFEVKEEILLQHTYVILKGLENERDKIGGKPTKSVDAEEISPKIVPEKTDSRTMKIPPIVLKPKKVRV